MSPTEPTCFCLACKYPLDGLPENRCPECGRPFDPADARTYRDAHYRTRLEETARAVGRVVLSPPVAILLIWANLVIPICLPVAVPLALASVVTNIVRRRRARAATTAMLCLLPIGCYLGLGIRDYLRDRATLRYMGLPGIEFYNPDPTYRCERSTGGCNVGGPEVVANACYNAAVRAMIRLFGPMAGSYIGPYPAKHTALTALQKSELVGYDALINDEVRLSAGTVKLDTGVGVGMLRGSYWHSAIQQGDDGNPPAKNLGQVSGVIWEGCLVLRIPSDFLNENDVPSAIIAVIDPVTGRPFAYYTEGRNYRRISPVPWRP